MGIFCLGPGRATSSRATPASDLHSPQLLDLQTVRLDSQSLRCAQRDAWRGGTRAERESGKEGRRGGRQGGRQGGKCALIVVMILVLFFILTSSQRPIRRHCESDIFTQASDHTYTGAKNKSLCNRYDECVPAVNTPYASEPGTRISGLPGTSCSCSTCMCVRVCKYFYRKHIAAHVRPCIYIHTYIHTNMHTDIYEHIFMICMSTYTYTYIYIHTHTQQRQIAVGVRPASLGSQSLP